MRIIRYGGWFRVGCILIPSCLWTYPVNDFTICHILASALTYVFPLWSSIILPMMIPCLFGSFIVTKSNCSEKLKYCTFQRFYLQALILANQISVTHGSRINVDCCFPVDTFAHIDPTFCHQRGFILFLVDHWSIDQARLISWLLKNNNLLLSIDIYKLTLAFLFVSSVFENSFQMCIVVTLNTIRILRLQNNKIGLFSGHA